jgi:hypothetical protein
MAAAEAQVFNVFLYESELRLTVKAKALVKPFGKTLVEPALKAFNAKRKADEQLDLESLEKVMLGPGGWIRSDVVEDLNASIASLIPKADAEPGEPLRVDMLPRVERKARLGGASDPPPSADARAPSATDDERVLRACVLRCASSAAGCSSRPSCRPSLCTCHFRTA